MDSSSGAAWSQLRRRYAITARSVTMLVSAVVTFGLLLVMMVTPVPFAVRGAGPTFDTLGKAGDTPLIVVDGAETYPTEGELLLTTVTTLGGPRFPVQAGDVIRGWLSPSMAVLPVEAVIDTSLTREEQDERSMNQMIGSQENATVAALTALGHDVPAELTIVGADPDLGAADVAQEGDVIRTVATPSAPTVTVRTYQDLADALAATPAGTTVTLGVERNGLDTGLEIVTSDDGSGGSLLGVFLDAEFDYPVDVRIEIDDVGGSSAGTMFALGIIDVLTPGPLTGGEVVAGTGTISLSGAVGPIGGIGLKLIGAHRDGADYFLAPAANCAEVVGHVPDGLEVFRMSTLDEALAAVDAIAAGDTSTLPTCESG